MPDPVVLQVEDDDAGYFVFNDLFKKICPDIRLERARDGSEALEKIEKLTADPAVDLRLILLDVFLPMIDGWEVLESIRAVEEYKRVPVVIFTNLVLERDRARCAALGVEYLEKPGDLQSLIVLVKEICARANSAAA
ncbi:MAG TPA: response regulator [Bryobacteraceae bacterium]